MEVKGQKLRTVTRNIHPEAGVTDDGLKPEALSRIAQATATVTKLKPV